MQSFSKKKSFLFIVPFLFLFKLLIHNERKEEKTHYDELEVKIEKNKNKYEEVDRVFHGLCLVAHTQSPDVCV